MPRARLRVSAKADPSEAACRPMLLFSRIRLLALVLLLAPVAVRAETSPGGERVRVEMDHAKIFRIAAPASTIIIGNPAIADATLQDTQTLIITGRAYGQTNLIVLDGQGETVSEAQIEVAAPSADLVTVYKGAKRLSLSCLPDCQPVAIPGDDGAHFQGILGQTSARDGAAAGLSANAAAAPAEK